MKLLDPYIIVSSDSLLSEDEFDVSLGYSISLSNTSNNSSKFELS